MFAESNEHFGDSFVSQVFIAEIKLSSENVNHQLFERGIINIVCRNNVLQLFLALI